jgi:hypothetical protein
MRQKQLVSKVRQLLRKDLSKIIGAKCLELFNSGAIDKESYGNDYLLPKAVLYVALEEVRQSIRPVSDEGKDAVKNLQHF